MQAVVIVVILVGTACYAVPDPEALCEENPTSGFKYGCKLHSFQIDSTEFTLFIAHVSVFANDDVERIEGVGQVIPYFPTKLFSYFKNIRELRLDSCGIKEMNEPFFNCDSLEYLILSFNSLVAIKKGIFSACSNIEIISMPWNSLVTIEDGALDGLMKLNQLVIQSNAFTSLPENLFKDKKNMKLINIARNSITEIPQKLLANTTALESFHADLNEYSYLPTHPGLFVDCGKLRYLLLFDSKLVILKSGAFEGLKSVEYLDLHSNQIDFIEGETFVGLEKMKTLILENNRLVAVNSNLFSSSQALSSLLIFNNPIRALSYDFFEHFPSLSTLTMDNAVCISGNFTQITPSIIEQFNQCFAEIIYCDNQNDSCQLSNLKIDESFGDKRIFIEQLEKKSIVTHLSAGDTTNMTFIPLGVFDSFPALQVVNFSHVGLARLDNLKDCASCANIQTVILDFNEFPTSSLIDFAKFSKLLEVSMRGNKLKSFRSSFFASDTVKAVNLTGNEIESVLIADGDLRSLEILDLSRNEIISLLFKFKFGTLRELYLDWNLLQILYENDFARLNTLEVLSISNNKLRVIENNAFASLTALKSLNLDANELQSLSSDEFGGKIPENLRNFSANRNKLRGISRHLIESLPAGANFSVTDNTCVSAEDYSDCIEKAEISCTFVYENQLYTCHISSAIVVSQHYPYSIVGEHKGLSTNFNVRGLIVQNEPLTKARSSLEDFSPFFKYNTGELHNEFPNLTIVKMDGIGLVFLNDILNCFKLKNISLERNQLYSLSRSVFQACTQLQFISLESNMIYSLGDGITMRLANLMHFNFGDNKMTRIAVDFFSYNENLETLKFHNNLIDSLEGITFLTLRNLRVLAIRGNPIKKLYSVLLGSLANLNELEMQSLNLTGPLPIDFFSKNLKLTSLSMNKNKINELREDLLKKQTMLTELDMSFCNITVIDDYSFESLSELKSLYLQGNHIEEINEIFFQNLVNLREIYLHRNKIATVFGGSFKNLKSLQTLRVDDNNIGELNETLFVTLVDLEHLDLSSNQISSITADMFKSLQEMKTLKIDFNNISMVGEETFRNLISLESVSLHGNKIDALPGKMFENTTKLQSLDLSLNRLTSIQADLFDCSSSGIFENVSTVNFGDNLIARIETEAFACLPSLTSLILRSNFLTTLSTAMIIDPASTVQKKMSLIDINNNRVNRISSDFFTKIAVTNFDAINNICLNHSFVYLSAANIPSELQKCEANILVCKATNSSSSCGIKYFQASDSEANLAFEVNVEGISASDVTVVTVSSSNASFIPSVLFETFENLESLTAASIFLKGLEEIKKCPKLKTLVLDSNPGFTLKDWNLVNCVKLETLSINGIHLKILKLFALSGLDSLQELRMQDSEIDNLNAVPASLRIIRMSRNSLRVDEHTFRDFRNLEELFIGESSYGFHKKCLEHLRNLTILDISKRNITNLNFPSFSSENNLKHLISNGIDVEVLSEEIFDNLDKLIELNMTDNLISEIKGTAFRSCRSLRHLNLENELRTGRISSLQVGTFDSLMNLEFLSLGGHQIAAISSTVFKSFKNLKVLLLKNNKIASIGRNALSYLINLEVLDLSHNEQLLLHPEVFLNLQNIKAMNLEGCQLKQLPSSIINLSTLTFLDVSQNQLKWLLFLPTYKSLEFLDMGSRQISVINPRFFSEIPETARIYSSSLLCGTLSDCMHDFNNLHFGSIVSDNRFGFACKVANESVVSPSIYSRSVVKYLHHKNAPLNFQVYELLEAYENVTNVDFWNSAITELIGIRTCSKLQHFDLRMNRIESVYDKSLSECMKLETLILIKNRISFISERSFANLTNLKLLDLSQNLIVSLHSETLRANLELEKLFLSRNKISSLASSLFASLTSLKTLRLANNSLTQLTDLNLFKSLVKLQELHINYNMISKIDEEVLRRLPRLKYLNVEHNQLTIIDLTRLSLRSLEYFDVSSNKIHDFLGNFDNFVRLRTFVANNNTCIDRSVANGKNFNTEIITVCKTKIKLEL